MNVSDLKLELGQRFEQANTTTMIPQATMELNQVPEEEETGEINSPLPMTRFGKLARNMTNTARMDSNYSGGPNGEYT